MIRIGENLNFERFEVEEFGDSEIILNNSSNERKTVPICDILKVELTGIKSNSGYSGTMEWGMSNPTFILPTNLWYNIINWFKRKNDTVYYKITVAVGEPFIVFSEKKIYLKIIKMLR